MAAGNTTTGSLADSQELIIDSARAIREFEGTYLRTCDMQRLAPNTGMSWEEISVSQLTAQSVTEQTVLDNAQQFEDTMLRITPTGIGIKTCVTDEVYRRLSKQTVAKLGALAGNAIARKKNDDYLTVLDGFTSSRPGAGATLDSSDVSAAARNIVSNTTEPMLQNDSLFTVLHGFQIHDIETELNTVGTYPIPSGMTAEVFSKGVRGMFKAYSTTVFEDGNITIDSAADAKGAVHARSAIICVNDFEMKKKTRYRPDLGMGAEEVFIYDKYGFGRRYQYGGYEIYSDATAP